MSVGSTAGALRDGVRIRVFWDGEKRWYTGTIRERGHKPSRHLVVYDDGDQHQEDFDSPVLQWELLDGLNWASDVATQPAKRRSRRRETMPAQTVLGPDNGAVGTAPEEAAPTSSTGVKPASASAKQTVAADEVKTTLLIPFQSPSNHHSIPSHPTPPYPIPPNPTPPLPIISHHITSDHITSQPIPAQPIPAQPIPPQIVTDDPSAVDLLSASPDGAEFLLQLSLHVDPPSAHPPMAECSTVPKKTISFWTPEEDVQLSAQYTRLSHIPSGRWVAIASGIPGRSAKSVRCTASRVEPWISLKLPAAVVVSPFSSPQSDRLLLAFPLAVPRALVLVSGSGPALGQLLPAGRAG